MQQKLAWNWTTRLRQSLPGIATVGLLGLILWLSFSVYRPTLLGVALVVVLAVCVSLNWIGQLADILNPTSAADIPHRGHLHILGMRVTVNWLISLLWPLLTWCLMVYLVYRVNVVFVSKTGWSNDGLHQPPPWDVVIYWILGKHWGPRAFLRLVLSIWLLSSLPAFYGIASLEMTKRRDRNDPERRDLHGMGMKGACSLLVLLAMTVTVSLLGNDTGIGPLSLIAWAPIVVLIAALFSPWPFTEAGKGLCNRERDGTAWKPLPVLNSLPGLDPVPTDGVVSAPKRPLVLICASGGGSRAALFTAGILSRIWWQENTLPDAWPNAIFQTRCVEKNSGAAERLYPGRLLLMEADVLSSVSGGSLACAYLMDSLFRWSESRKGIPSRQDRQIALQEFFGAALSARPKVYWYGQYVSEPESLRWRFEKSADYPPLKDAALRRFETNPFINAMRQDHLAACLSGFFLPWVGRGPGIERFWRQMFGWTDPLGHSRRLSDFREYEETGFLSTLVLNGTLSRTGTRIALTNLAACQFEALPKYGPPVQLGDLGESPSPGSQAAEQERRRAEARFDPLPGHENTLNGLDSGWDIFLETATRASANFPIGFPLIRFLRRDANGEPMKYAGGPDVLGICDGGVLDNTAVDSVMALLRANRDQVRERGVLIFQIDSGELPRNPRRTAFDFLLYHLTEVKDALWRSGIDNQVALHSLYLDELRALLGETAPPKAVVSTQRSDYILGYEGEKYAFFQVRAGELAAEHVMTSWHLNEVERQRLYGEVCEVQQGEAILKAALWLASRC